MAWTRIERMDENCFAVRVTMREVSGRRAEGRPMLGWMGTWCDVGLEYQRNDDGISRHA